MEARHVLFFLDYNKLRMDYTNAVKGRFDANAPLFKVYYGLDDDCGLPVWFIANSTAMTNIKNLQSIQNEMKQLESSQHIRVTAILPDGDTKNLERTKITYTDVAEREQLQKEMGEESAGFFSLFQEECGILLNDKAPNILMKEKPPLVRVDKQLISVSPAGIR